MHKIKSSKLIGDAIRTIIVLGTKVHFAPTSILHVPALFRHLNSAGTRHCNLPSLCKNAEATTQKKLHRLSTSAPLQYTATQHIMHVFYPINTSITAAKRGGTNRKNEEQRGEFEKSRDEQRVRLKKGKGALRREKKGADEKQRRRNEAKIQAL